LICTGPVTRQARERLIRTYEQMPEPRYVVAVGSCALSGGAFQNCYNVIGSIDEVIPVDAYIPGCPPRPEAIIDGLVKLLQSLQTAPGSETQAKGSGVKGQSRSASNQMIIE
jgi:NADH:ubiquinone oxidoreductase subunit B-like Fe-S oxidoreductase